jgi:hypothetical protein
MATVTTPWGKASILEEVEIEQEADGRPFSARVELLEGPDGSSLVRFAYSTGGSARRGPVTLRVEDLDALREQIRGTPRLARTLRLREAR